MCPSENHVSAFTSPANDTCPFTSPANDVSAFTSPANDACCVFTCSLVSNLGY